MSGSATTPDARARLEARSKLQEQRAVEARKANEQVAADGVAERAKTERLRALRLAKEEADRAAAPPPAVKKAAKKKA